MTPLSAKTARPLSTATSGNPAETISVTVVPGLTLLPAGGLVAMSFPAGTFALIWRTCWVGTPALESVLAAAAALLPAAAETATDAAEDDGLDFGLAAGLGLGLGFGFGGGRKR